MAVRNYNGHVSEIIGEVHKNAGFYLQIPISENEIYSFCVEEHVADTFWSVHIKCCFHQKKTKSKRPTTRIRHAKPQNKGRDQSNTKNVTNKTSRLHSVAKQHRVSDTSVWNPKTNCIWTNPKTNCIWTQINLIWKTKEQRVKKRSKQS